MEPENRDMVKIRPTPYEQVDQFAQETRLAARIFEELARRVGRRTVREVLTEVQYLDLREALAGRAA